MPRQIHYQERIEARPGQIQMADIGGPPQGFSAGGQLVKDALGTAGDVFDALGREMARVRAGKIDDAIMKYDERMELFRQNYMRERQGANAATAQADFMAKHEELAKLSMDESGFGDNMDLKRKLQTRAMYAIRDGGQWQARQRGEWEKSRWQGQMAAFQRMAGQCADDPDRMAMQEAEMIQSWQAMNPGRDPTAIKAQLRQMNEEGRLNQLLLEERYDDVIALIRGSGATAPPAGPAPDARSGERSGERSGGSGAGSGGSGTGSGAVQAATGGIGATIARFESGSDGHLAIGCDSTGGTSYGRFQLSSARGSMGEWLDLLARDSPEGAKLAAQIRAAGPLNCGRKGAAAEAYKRAASENPDLIERTQREYIVRTHYDPALKGLPPNLRAMVEADPSLQEALFSTAVQHGGGGAKRIFSAVFREGIGREEFIRAIYKKRGTQFSKSTPKERAAVQNRFAEEVETILKMNQDGGMTGGASGGPSTGSEGDSGEAGGSGGGANPQGGASMFASFANSLSLEPQKQAAYLHRATAAKRQAEQGMRVGIAAKLDNWTAQCDDGLVSDCPVTGAEIRRAFGDQAEGILSKVNDAKNRAVILSSMKTMSAAEAQATAEQMRPQAGDPDYKAKMAAYGRVSQAATNLAKAQANSPVEWILANDNGASEARKALLSPGGFTPDNWRAYANAIRAGKATREIKGEALLSKADAQLLADNLQKATNPGAALKALERVFGQDYTGAIDSILPKCSDQMRLFASGMDDNAIRLVWEAEKDPKFEDNMYAQFNLEGADKKEFQQEVADCFEEFTKTMHAAGHTGSMIETVKRTARILAFRYMQSGRSQSEAISMATKAVLLDRYDFIENGNAGVPYRIPKSEGFEAERIATGAAQWLRGADTDGFQLRLENGQTAKIQKDAIRSVVRNDCHWTTNDDESGLDLKWGTQPVLDKNGKPVTVAWEEFAKLAKEDDGERHSRREGI